MVVEALHVQMLTANFLPWHGPIKKLALGSTRSPTLKGTGQAHRSEMPPNSRLSARRSGKRSRPLQEEQPSRHTRRLSVQSRQILAIRKRQQGSLARSRPAWPSPHRLFPLPLEQNSLTLS